MGWCSRRELLKRTIHRPIRCLRYEQKTSPRYATEVMYSRIWQRSITIPPLLWVMLFLLLPYLFLFTFSLWQVRSQTIVHEWTTANYRQLITNPVYMDVLLRSARIAGSVTLFAVLLAFPLAYYVSFRTTRWKNLLYLLVIIPLWVSYLVRAYAWKTILGNDGVLNTLLMYAGVLSHPAGFLLYS